MSDPSFRLGRRAVLQGGLAVSVMGGMAPLARAGQSTTRPSAAAPTIAGTAEWGARDATQEIEIRDSKPTFIVVHHTATENSSDTSKEHAFALARSIQDAHMDENGWGDTGQNFTNSRGGWLMEGRHESLATLQDGTRYVKGIHAGDANTDSQGIENEGLYTEEDVPDDLWNSLVELCSYICSQYGIAAEEIYGHRDFMSTECPGEVLYGRLPELREAVGAALGVPSVRQPVTWPLLKPGRSGPAVSAAQHLLRAAGKRVPVNGAYDAATQRAVEEVAAVGRVRKYACNATRVDEPGLLGADLWQRLAPTLTPGSRGEAVRALNLLLTSHGQRPDQGDTVTDRTVAALRAFQSDRSVRVTGTADAVTWKHLLS